MNDNEIYVIDTETTGLERSDLVVEVGICKVNTADCSVKDVYSSVVGYDVSKWDKPKKNAWIFSNSDLKLDDVKNAKKYIEVVNDIKGILFGKNVTAYNISFDFGKFLQYDPWNLTKSGIRLRGCLMLAADYIDEIPRSIENDDFRSWPKLDVAYSVLCPDDPADIKGEQTHRALSDARMASHILLKMTEMGYYPSEYR